MLNGRHDVMVDVMSTVCHDIIDDNCHWFDVTKTVTNVWNCTWFFCFPRGKPTIFITGILWDTSGSSSAVNCFSSVGWNYPVITHSDFDRPYFCISRLFLFSFSKVSLSEWFHLSVCLCVCLLTLYRSQFSRYRRQISRVEWNPISLEPILFFWDVEFVNKKSKQYPCNRYCPTLWVSE